MIFKIKNLAANNYLGTEFQKVFLKIKSALEDIKDCFGNSPKITWFVRADNEINKIYGDSNFIFKKFHKIWRECEFLGDAKLDGILTSVNKTIKVTGYKKQI